MCVCVCVRDSGESIASKPASKQASRQANWDRRIGSDRIRWYCIEVRVTGVVCSIQEGLSCFLSLSPSPVILLAVTLRCGKELNTRCVTEAEGSARFGSVQD